MSKRHQITCICGAYKFPHRLGGGKCDGNNWVKSYKELDGRNCEFCNSFNSGFSGAGGSRRNTCDVIEQLETFLVCEGYQEYLDTQPTIRLPTSITEYMRHEYPDEFEE